MAVQYKITDLTAISTLADGDLFEIVDFDADQSKKVSVSQLAAEFATSVEIGTPIGSATANRVLFTDGSSDLAESDAIQFNNGLILTAQAATHTLIKGTGHASQSANILEFDVTGQTGGKSFKLTSNGRTYLGLNTLTPNGQRLFVEGTALDTKVATFQNPAGYAVNFASYSGYAIVSGGDGTSTFQLLNDTSYSFYVGGTRRLLVNSTGVGINVSSLEGSFHSKSQTLNARAGLFQGTSSQNVNILEVWNSAGTSLDAFNKDGWLSILHGTPTVALDINSDIIRLRTAKTPASASATGLTGSIAWDSNYIYIATATNTWKRAALTTW